MAPAPLPLPLPALTVQHLSVAYHEAPVLWDVSWTTPHAGLAAIVGPNGAGKSTLIKVLAGELAPQVGEMRGAKDLAVGYFAQHQLEQLDAGASALAHLQRIDPNGREQEQRNFLGSFNFDGDMVTRAVGTFSGGEKARLVLALLMHARPNLLLLDEPTNHLDIDMRHALTLALQDFAGALIVVAHDRHLLRMTADQLMLVDGGKVTLWDGDLDDYARWLAGGRRSQQDAAANDTATPERVNEKQRRQQGAQLRAQLKPLRDALKKAEGALERVEQRRADLDARLADPALYEPARKEDLKRLLAEKARIEQEREVAEAEWLTHAEALEQAEREAAA